MVENKYGWQQEFFQASTQPSDGQPPSKPRAPSWPSQQHHPQQPYDTTVPFSAPHGGPDHGARQQLIPTWVTATTYVVSVLKFLPLLLVLAMAFLGSLIGPTTSASGPEGDAGIVSILVFLVIVGALGVLLVAHVVGAAKQHKMLLVSVAAVLLILDLLLFISNILENGPEGFIIGIILPMTVAQAGILVGAVTAKTSQVD